MSSAMTGMTDEPDILATAPDGYDTHYRMHNEGAGRQEAHHVGVANGPDARGNPSIPGREAAEIVTLLISSLPAEEVAFIREKAAEHSVIVLTREDIVDAVARTNYCPDQKGVLRHWKNSGLMRVLNTGRMGEI